MNENLGSDFTRSAIESLRQSVYDLGTVINGLPQKMVWKNTSRKCLITKSEKQNAQKASNKALRSISKLSRTLMSESPRLWR